MDRNGMWVLLAMVAAASGAAVNKGSAPSAATAQGEKEGGGEEGNGPAAEVCSGPEARIEAYLWAAGERPVQAPSERSLRPAEPVHVVIATVPDPFASRLDYQFDLVTSALQQAAEADQYTFDRYGLSWDLERARDPKLSSTLERCPRAEPGVLIFRKDARKDRPRETLLVLLVGETPTAGVHPLALHRSIELARSYASPPPSDVEPIRIVGPTFSGSAESLRRILDGHPSLAFHIVAGGATGESVADLLTAPHPTEDFPRAFLRKPVKPGSMPLLTPGPGLHGRLRARAPLKSSYVTVAPRTFSRTTHTNRSLRDKARSFLTDHLHIDSAQIALLVEESTTYGGEAASAGGRGSSKGEGVAERDREDWQVLRFPLHVSQVRRAFESSRADPGKQAEGTYELPRLLLGLRTDHTQRPGEVLRNFSDATGNYDELMLVSELSSLCRKRIKAIGVLATDGRDRRFLVGKVRQLCPDALPFTFGGDLLFAYPEEREALSGTVIFSSYPLFLPVRSWGATDHGQPIRPPQDPFGDSMSAAVYNAMVVQLDAWEERSAPGLQGGGPLRPRLPGFEGTRPVPKMLDHGCPYAPSDPKPGQKAALSPPIWISLVSREGLLPLDVRCDADDRPGDRIVPATAAFGGETSCEEGGQEPKPKPPRKVSPLRFGRARTLLFTLLALSLYAAWLTRRWRPIGSAKEPGAGEEGGDAHLAARARAGNSLRALFFLLNFVILAALVLEVRMCLPCPPPSFFIRWVLRPIGPLSVGLSGTSAVAAAVMAVRPRWELRGAAYAAVLLAVGASMVCLDNLVLQAYPVAKWLGVDDYRVLMTAARATYFTSGVSPVAPLLVMAGVIHCLLYVLLRRSCLGGPGAGPFLPLFGKAPPKTAPLQTIHVADTHIRALTRIVPGQEKRWEFIGLILALAFSMLVAFRRWSPTPEGAWFDCLFQAAFALAVLTIAAAWLRSVLLWQALRTVLQRVARHPLRHALRKLPRHALKSRFTHEPTAYELEGSMELLSRCDLGRWGPSGCDAGDVAEVEENGAAHGKSVWATALFKRYQEIAAELASDEQIQARWRAPGTTTEEKRPQPSELFIARQFTLTVTWVVAHIRLELVYLTVGSLGILLAAGSYAFTSARLLTLMVWIVVIASAATATWLVLDFNRTEVAGWMVGARAGKVIDWKLAGHLVTVGIVPLLALLAFQFPTLGQWLSTSLGPVVHVFGAVAGGGGD